MGNKTEQREGLLNGRADDDDGQELESLASPSEFEHSKRHESSSFTNPMSRRKRWPFVVLAAILVLGFLYFLSRLYGHPLFRASPEDDRKEANHTEDEGMKSPSLVPNKNFTKPEDLKIVGIIFYGRRDRVSILDCYLKDNLAENGGILDEIQFMTMTDNKEDIAWLDAAVARTPGYKKIYNETKPKLEWFDGYNALQRGVMYVKMDDDLVFIGDDAIPRMVHTALEHPEYLVVAANMINSPLISWIHYMIGAVRPFLPELEPAENAPSKGDKFDWRTSKLPTWDGPADFEMKSDTPPPFQNHRWLPMKSGTSTDKTPIARAEYNAFGNGWKEWSICAQQHYSFFANMEQDPSLEVYRYNIWETGYHRLSINLIAFKGEDILDNGPVPSEDEEYITVQLPKKLHRHVAIDGNAIASHYSFGPQVWDEHGGIAATDVLERYRMYAEDKVCKGSTQY